MKKSVWASALGLAALLWASSPVQAQDGLPGDCNGDGEVVISELIIAVNISLGSTPVGSCLAADTSNNGAVEINELIQAVNCANGSCGNGNGPACGDGTEDTAEGEECDDGNNVGGDGCAANCTDESARVGVFDPDKTIAIVQTEAIPITIKLVGQQTFRTGSPRDTAVQNADGETIYQPGEMPVVIRANELIFAPVRVTGLVCACVRGFPVESFGEGVSAMGSIGCGPQGLTDISYRLIQDHNTDPGDPDNRCNPSVASCPGTPNDPECDDETLLPGGTTSEACREGDPDAPGCANDPGMEEEHPHIDVCNGPRVLSRFGGQAPPGSAFIINNTAIGLLQDRGTCKPNATLPNGTCEFADYGPDCMPCTSDDLELGIAENIGTTTASAEAAVFDPNNSESIAGSPPAVNAAIDKDRDCFGVCHTIRQGSLFDCDALLADPDGGLSGGSLAVAFPSIDAATIGDNVTSTVFFNQTTPTP